MKLMNGKNVLTECGDVEEHTDDEHVNDGPAIVRPGFEADAEGAQRVGVVQTAPRTVDLSILLAKKTC